jgi:chromosome segregation ATPase
MSNSNDISQIRNLIFGETIKSFEGRFASMDNEVAEINKKLDKLLAQLSGEKSERQNESKQLDGSLKDLNAHINDLKTELLEKLNSLEDSKAARLDLAKIFSDVSAQLNNVGKK